MLLSFFSNWYNNSSVNGTEEQKTAEFMLRTSGTNETECASTEQMKLALVAMSYFIKAKYENRDQDLIYYYE